MKINAEKAAAALLLLDERSEELGNGSVSEEWEAGKAELAADLTGLVDSVAGSAVALVLEKWGLEKVELDKERPFSDESLSRALSAAVGVTIESIKSREKLRAGIVAAMTRTVSEKTGVQFTELKDRVKTKKEVIKAAGRRISAIIPGLELNDLSDKKQTVDDVYLFVQRMISDKTGIYFTNIRSREAIKEDIYAWAEPEVRRILGEEVATNAKKPLKMDKRAIQNRRNQRVFRETNGPRNKYEVYQRVARDE